MKLKLTNATWIFFLFLIAIVAYSCTPDKDDPENKSCSSTNKTGDCPDKKSCVNGLCIYQCSDTIACPENYHCFENTCFDTQKLCSSGNHFGKCDGNDTCVEGVCKNLNPCNRDFPNGICF